MFLSHISFAMGLIALISGLAMYLWSVRAEAGVGIGLAKTIGIIVFILAILQIVCTVYTGIRFKQFIRSHATTWMEHESCPMKNNAPQSMQNSQNSLTPLSSENSQNTSMSMDSGNQE